MQKVVILGTGGTIAGVAAAGRGHVNYSAGAVDAGALAGGLPPMPGVQLEAETLARLDSRDMDHATWVLLGRRAAAHMARADVAGVVVTHGTDTLEETAYFLHRTLHAPKPLVLTAAMRPASALSPDGPQNLADAVAVALQTGARGVLAVLSGQVHGGADLRKVHGYRVDAFSSGDAGPLAAVEDGVLRCFRPWPGNALHAADVLGAGAADAALWPVVDVVTSHAGARAAVIDALVAAGARGIVIAGTGNGSVHAALLAAAVRARAAGVQVLRASRCQLGGVVGVDSVDSVDGDGLPSAGPLTAVQARIELMLDLLAAA